MNKTSTPFLVMLLFFCVISSLSAQSISREIISSNGGFHEGEVMVSWTIGEPITEMYLNSDLHQGQGFQQGAYLEEDEFLQSLELEGERLSVAIVNLDWQLRNERQAVGYVIERKLEHQEAYEEIGFVELSKEKSTEKEYDFVDLNEFFGSTFYRIQQVDADGNPLYSNEIEVKGSPLKGSFTVFPSPTTGPLTLGASKDALNTENDLTVRISDVNGQELYLTEVNRKGNVTKLPNISHLSSGSYTVTVLHGERVHQSFRIFKIGDR